MADELFARISSLLEDPETADKVKQMAASLGAAPPSSEAPLPASAGEIDLSRLGSLIGNLNVKNNREVALLHAIQPYMRPARAAKIGSAVKAIQVLSILSSLQNL